MYTALSLCVLSIVFRRLVFIHMLKSCCNK